MAASCCLGSRDTPSERPPVRTFPQPGRLGARLPRGEGAGGGHRPRGLGVPQTTLDPCPPTLRPVLPTRRLQAPLPRLFVFFFFCWKQDSIHIEYNIFVYLTGRGGGDDRGGAGPAARYSSPRGHWGRDPRPLPSPLCTVLRGNTHLVSKECILRCVFVCMCVRLWF